MYLFFTTQFTNSQKHSTALNCTRVTSGSVFNKCDPSITLNAYTNIKYMIKLSAYTNVL